MSAPKTRTSFPVIALLSSAALALIFVLIGVLFWRHDHNEFKRTMVQESAALRTTFEVAMSDLEQQMLVLATMVAADGEVQSLYYSGKRALEREGGGPGGTETAHLRDALYDQVAPTWLRLQDEFSVRQLHFQLGPGALSYLRVHAPDKFGDRMDNLRHIIADVNADQQPRTGFETGRVYSGVRGVVPVWYSTPKGRAYVGALEAGTSMDTQLARLDRQFGAGFAVLLKQTHVENAVWHQYLYLNGPGAVNSCQCYLEASSRDEVKDWMRAAILQPLQEDTTVSDLLTWNNKTWHLTRFPLRDYLGKNDPARPAVGSILVWRDKTAALTAWRKHQTDTQLSLFLAYALTQVLLLWLLFTTRSRLQRRIDEATAALTVATERLTMAVQGADLGLWDWHIPSGQITYNERWAEMLGYRLDEIQSDLAGWKSLLHPDDLAQIDTELKRHLDGETALYETEHRIRHKDGHWLWVLDRGKVMERAEDGTPLRAVGTHLDISARKDAENQLRENEAMLQRAQSVGHIGSWKIDMASGALSWSDETYRIFNLAPDTPADYKLFLSFIHPDDREHVHAAWQAALRGAPYDIEHRIIVKGETRWVHERAELVLNAAGVLTSAVGTVQDVTVLKRMELELRHLATTDTLTGLPNRREFLDGMAQELARFHRFGKPAALLMIDLDHFKTINDQYGHATGDAVLRHFAELAHGTLRKVDYIGRLGGEEFAILLPGTDAAGAHLYAERLRQTVQNNPYRANTRVPLTISVGMTQLEPNDNNSDMPLARADSALYRAKNQGRNRVESA